MSRILRELDEIISGFAKIGKARESIHKELNELYLQYPFCLLAAEPNKSSIKQRWDKAKQEQKKQDALFDELSRRLDHIGKKLQAKGVDVDVG